MTVTHEPGDNAPHLTKHTLSSRLLLSHLIVLGVGIVTLAGLGWFYSPRLFVVSLERIEGRGYSVRQVRTQLIQGFEFAWTRGMFWSVLTGGAAAGGVSYWFSQRIVRPLVQLESVTQKFAAGDLEARVPANEILELDRLAISFNRMADDLRDVEQRRRDLVSDLSHELRTPLTILHGYLEGLADGTVEASPDLYQRLSHETSRLQRLVNDLQELSKLESGYLPVQLKAIALEPLLQGIVTRFAGQLTDDSPVTLTLSIPDSLPPTWADPIRVEQILVNLLGNALRYTPEGQVTVKAWVEAAWVWIAVVDTGIGIAEADLSHLFERFWRADRSRDRTSGGTGIGLTICRRLVELQGGRIEVESQLGQGSTFRFCLPTSRDSPVNDQDHTSP